MTTRLGLGALGGQVSFYKDAASTRLPSLQPALAGISGNNPQICHTPPRCPSSCLLLGSVSKSQSNLGFYQCPAMIPGRLLQLIFSVLCVSSVVLGEDRLGLVGISDGTLTNRSSSIPYGPSSSQTNLNGGFVLLGSLRLKENLFVFYEGRVNHSEGLGGTFPRLQRTQ